MSLIPQFHSVPAQADHRQGRGASRRSRDCLPRRNVVEEGRSRRLKTPDPFLHSTDRCSHVAVRRLPGNARCLQRQRLASITGAAIIEN